MNLQQELVVISGANGGIGKALCLEFLKRGAFVCALDLDNTTLLNELKDYAGKMSFYKVDVSNEDQWVKVTDQFIQDFQKLPFVWINNAGISKVDHFENISSADFDRVLSVNLHGVIYGTRIALNVMKNPERGHIVNVSSVNGAVATPFMTAYVASKHAVDGFTRSIQMEKKFKHSAIKIHLVSPGFAKTNIMPASGEFIFPKALDFMISSPETVALEIVEGLIKNAEEIRPTVNGKVMIQVSRFFPGANQFASRALLAKNWKELLGFSPIKNEK